jgi:hypothetical protein
MSTQRHAPLDVLRRLDWSGGGTRERGAQSLRQLRKPQPEITRKWQTIGGSTPRGFDGCGRTFPPSKTAPARSHPSLLEVQRLWRPFWVTGHALPWEEPRLGAGWSSHVPAVVHSGERSQKKWLDHDMQDPRVMARRKTAQNGLNGSTRLPFGRRKRAQQQRPWRTRSLKAPSCPSVSQATIAQHTLD